MHMGVHTMMIPRSVAGTRFAHAFVAPWYTTALWAFTSCGQKENRDLVPANKNFVLKFDLLEKCPDKLRARARTLAVGNDAMVDLDTRVAANAAAGLPPELSDLTPNPNPRHIGLGFAAACPRRS